MRSLASRDSVLQDMAAGTLDVFVMGGGINGAGILRDLALRSASARQPLRLGLADRSHFSSGTSGRNSQLIHGGLRYLKNFEFHLVSEALAERATLLKTAPHLVEPLAFVIPMRDLFNAVFYGSGLFLYDFLAGKNKIKSHTRLSGSQLRQTEPRMRPFFSGAKFYDCRVHSARLVILNIREAVSHGALAANYASVQSYERDDEGMWHIELRDELSGRVFPVRSRALVNAAGAWSRESKLRLVRGSHLVLPRIGNSENAISYFGEDGRIIFFIPWGRGHRYTLVGTTDVDHEAGPEHIRISDEEVRYLLNVIEEVFPGAGPHEPICAYSSLRPLVRDESAGATATKTSREHRIWADQEGMINVSGGKYTTYRLMSEEASDLVVRERWPELKARHLTASTPIAGNSQEAVQELMDDAAALASEYRLEESEVRELVKDYGVDTAMVLAQLPPETITGVSVLEAAQIAFAAEHEWVERLSDLMFVSTYWGYERRWTPTLLTPYARELAQHLGWDEARMQDEIVNMLVIADQPRAAVRAETVSA